jgi:hypothetical protein
MIPSLARLPEFGGRQDKQKGRPQPPFSVSRSAALRACAGLGGHLAPARITHGIKRELPALLTVADARAFDGGDMDEDIS